MAIAMWRELQVELATARANGEECCGLAALTPLVLFFVVAPVCGLFGASTAQVFVWFWSDIGRVSRKHVARRPPDSCD